MHIHALFIPLQPRQSDNHTIGHGHSEKELCASLPAGGGGGAGGRDW